MKKNKALRIGLIVLALLVVFGLGAYYYLSLPTPGAQFPMPGVQVVLTAPWAGEQVSAGTLVQTQISVLADAPLSAAELWVDGERVRSQEYLVGAASPLEENWDWVASKPGPHVLVARAMDDQGRVGQSAPLLISVLYAPPAGPYTALEGETLGSIAAKFQQYPAALGASNPGIDPNAPLPAGQQVNLPGGGESAPPTPPPAGQEPGNPPGKLAIVFSDIAGAITGGFPPSAPKLAIGAQGCQIKLVITPGSDDALGYTVFGLQLAAQNYVQLATIGPGQDPLAPTAWLDPQPFMTNIQYFVAAFNAAGTNASNFVSLQDAAGALGANGCFVDDAPGAGGVIELPLLTAEFSASVPVEQSYCYLTTGAGDWFRYPANDFQFFQQGPLTGLEAFLQSADDPGQMKAECWGWEGGALQFLGEASATYPPNPADPSYVMKGDSFDLTLSTGIQSAIDTQPVISGWFLKIVPPPVNLRPAVTKDVCVGHNGNKITPSPCNQIGAVIQTHNVLVWDWAPQTCWGNCKWNNNITGFRIFQYAKKSFAKPLPIMDAPVGVTAAAVPIPWWDAENFCYIVKAYADGGGNAVYSASSNSFCLGNDPLPTKTVTLNASDWITTTDIYSNGDCVAYNDTKGMWDDQVMVGVYQKSYGDCDWDQRHYDAAVKFDLGQAFPVGSNVSIQKATLNFNMVLPVVSSKGGQPLCATDLSYERLAWENWDPAAARAGKTDMLSWGTNASPYLQLHPYGSSAGPATSADVTQAVLYWLKNPQYNHGLVLWTDINDLHNLGIKVSSSDYYCLSRLWGFSLEINYYDVP